MVQRNRGGISGTVSRGADGNLGIAGLPGARVSVKETEGRAAGGSRVTYPDPEDRFILQFPHYYILEMYRLGGDGTLTYVDGVHLRHTGHVTMSAPVSVARRFTLNGLDEQHSGIRERHFTLSGRSGNLPHQVRTFWLLRDFVERYAHRKRESENAFAVSDTWYLILNFTWEGERFVASIADFSYSRDVGDSPHSFKWSMSLKTNGTAPSTFNSSKGRYLLDIDYNTLGRGSSGLPAVAGAARNRLANSPLDVAPQVSAAEATTVGAADAHLVGEDGVTLLKDTSVKSTVTAGLDPLATSTGVAFAQKHATNIETVVNSATQASTSSGMNLLQAAISGLQSAENAWSSFWYDWVTQPLDQASRGRALLSVVASSLRGSAWAFRTAVGRYYYAVPEWRAHIAWFASDVQRSIDVYEDGWTELKSMFTAKYWRDVLGISPTRMVATISARTRGTVVAVPVPSGSRSAYDVAAEVLGSRERWTEVVDANGMRDAYTLGNGIPIESGDIIFVPAPPGTPDVPMNEPFGSDIKLVDGDIALNGTDDFAVVRGIENIQQSIRHRLVTPRGANKAFPGFGLISRLNERKTSTIYGLLWSDIRDQVSSDPRIQRILRLMMDELPYGYVVQLEYQLIGHARNVVSFQYSLPG